MTDEKVIVRLAAIGDIHFAKTSGGSLQTFFSQISDSADVLVMCGDLTNLGLPEEAKGLAKELSQTVKIPMVAVLGNHDFESDKQDEIRDILSDAGVTVLDGESCEIKGVGFAGVKGFCGGFGQHTLEPWGEPAIKRFVQEAVDEALKLESALARLHDEPRIAVLHYAPIPATVEGEPLEVFPFLGSSRLEDPFTRYPVHAAFHGHAHHGTHQGMTRGDVPVYNVAMPLLRQLDPDQQPFRVFNIPVPS
jgi:Icc-related predicted phosphoesterase